MMLDTPDTMTINIWNRTYRFNKQASEVLQRHTKSLQRFGQRSSPVPNSCHSGHGPVRGNRMQGFALAILLVYRS